MMDNDGLDLRRLRVYPLAQRWSFTNLGSSKNSGKTVR